MWPYSSRLTKSIGCSLAQTFDRRIKASREEALDPLTLLRSCRLMRSNTLRRAALCWGLLPASIATATRGTNAIDALVHREAKAVLERSLGLYRWLHAHPELSGQERITAKRLATELRSLGLSITTAVGGNGIVGIMRGTAAGPVVLYRADMDGLPVLEATRAPYASQNRGVMHACGHDVHMASAIGALSVLSRLRKRWRGTIVFVAQPAEETGEGAQAVLKDRKFRQILSKVGKPKIALALHDAADIPAGKIAIAPGYVNANVDSVDIVVYGKGGHGARPHEAIDPIIIGAEIVTALQTIVSRRLAAGQKAVVTVGSFRAGTKHNIIPPTARLLLTVRSYSDQTRQFVLGEIKHIALSVARAHRVLRPPKVLLHDPYTPAAYNNPKSAQRLRGVFARVLGAKRVSGHPPSLGGEDFGNYSRSLGIPGVMWKLGAAKATTIKRRGRRLTGLHSNKWLPDAEPTLRTGIISAASAMLTWLDTKTDQQ